MARAKKSVMREIDEELGLPAKACPAGDPLDRVTKLVVRGADGSLYLIPEADMEPFKLQDKPAQALAKVLDQAGEDVVATKLSSRVHKQIYEVGGCIRQGPPTLFLAGYRKKG